MANVVVVHHLNPSGLLKKEVHKEASTFDVTGHGDLLLFEGQNAKTSKMPISAYAVGQWDSVSTEADESL